MAFPKSFLLLGLLFASALLISSHVSARELAETTQQIGDKEDVHKDGYGYYGHHGGHHYGSYHGRQGYGGYHDGYHGHYPLGKIFAEIDGYDGYEHSGHGYKHDDFEYGGYGPGGPGPYGPGGPGPYELGGTDPVPPIPKLHRPHGPPKDEVKKN
ncbi:hypothetical protein Nepgr_026854 [Nepenthes gracilis]|uniref:Uncharacterized protein n=1 Tax=Nepenthes gracilis TaxID=150966 RepID=A0AAD3TAH6_NEPGR|nr:hypothetical protein Nepgr_026854 [Nepenthes gracilis]